MNYLEWEKNVEAMPKIVNSDYPVGMVEEIERFLADDAKRPPGLDSYEDCFRSNLFFPLQRRREMEKMIRIARVVGKGPCPYCICNCGADRTGPSAEAHDDACPANPNCERCGNLKVVAGPVTVMEIGADKGAGVYHWVKCLPTVRRMIACEIRGTPYSAAFEKAFPQIDFVWMPRPSLPANVGWEIDVLFIDGDKNGMLADFDAYLPLMNPRGVVFMHDVNDGAASGPRRAFEEVKRRGYRTEEIIDTSEIWAFDGNNLASNPYEHWLCHWNGRSAGVGVVYLQKELAS